jgi:hypothetical protein
MVLAFMNPPNEKPLTRETVANLLQQALPEVRYPTAERLAILIGMFTVMQEDINPR